MTRYQTFERAEPVSPATPAKLWGNGALAIAFLAGVACAMVGNSMIPGQLSAAGSDGETSKPRGRLSLQRGCRVNAAAATRIVCGTRTRR